MMQKIRASESRAWVNGRGGRPPHRNSQSVRIKSYQEWRPSCLSYIYGHRFSYLPPFLRRRSSHASLWGEDSARGLSHLFPHTHLSFSFSRSLARSSLCALVGELKPSAVLWLSLRSWFQYGFPSLVDPRGFWALRIVEDLKRSGIRGSSLKSLKKVSLNLENFFFFKVKIGSLISFFNGLVLYC